MKQYQAIIKNDPILRTNYHYWDKTREEMFETLMKKLHRFKEVGFVHTFENADKINYFQKGSITGIHHAMFETTLVYLADEEQSKEWVEKARAY